MNNYCIMKDKKRLSQFVPNDFTKNQLRFRLHDYYTFSTIEEAEHFISHIQSYADARTKPSTLKLRTGQS